jgi:hypothetical protein
MTIFGVVPIVCEQGYSYQAFGGDCSGPLVPQQSCSGTPGFGWNLSLYGDGLTGPNTTFTPVVRQNSEHAQNA